MVGLSPYGENQVLTPLITNGFVSLHTADPQTTGLNEISTTGTGYARMGAVAFTVAPSEPTVASNTNIITFAPATAAWGTITHFGVWDAVTGGNFRGSGAMTTPKPVNNGDTARFAAGALTITVQ